MKQNVEHAQIVKPKFWRDQDKNLWETDPDLNEPRFVDISMEQ